MESPDMRFCNDTLDGGNGRFLPRSSIAQVFGGGGTDTAEADDDDVLVSIENMLA